MPNSIRFYLGNNDLSFLGQSLLDNNENLWFFKLKENRTEAKLVPPIKDRIDRINKSHLLGHFKLEKTYNDILKKFWWKGLWKQCDHIIKNCMICLRFSKSTTFKHHALVFKIKDIFDTAGIDLVFGFPETQEGYIGILVITEYLTKYPYVVPIKSKSATEIARHLFNYICLFGPPKELLSDQGKEFLNQIVEAILKLSGTENLVTSAYSPNTKFDRKIQSNFCRSFKKTCRRLWRRLGQLVKFYPISLSV